MSAPENSGNRVILVHVNFPAGRMEADLVEFKELAVSAGAHILQVLTGTRCVPESKYFVGSGKAKEIAESVKAYSVDLVIFNHVLSPAQERNLERLIKCRVLDRTGLILDIFAQRARSFEGKLQVELALLKHSLTRLVRGWTHLERQQGGIGLRGPGETQLEVDRRLIRNKIKQISGQLVKIRSQRYQSRRSRKKAAIPTVALIGYTNAGKSTLFNRLTGSQVYVADQLFATLDPTFRRVQIVKQTPIILADTVGFIRHLPHDLVEAFHATLEEVTEADLLLHVIDAGDLNREDRIIAVDKVLETIGAAHLPRLLVYNKIDQLLDVSPRVERDEQGQARRIYLSALTGKGFEELGLVLAEILTATLIETEVVLLPNEAKLRAQLYAEDAVLVEHLDEEGRSHFRLRITRVALNRLFR